MILNPAVIAVAISSLLISGMVIYASAFGIQILRKWDIKSGSEIQLNLERKTYLISTMLSYAFVFQLISLFLFIYTADNLHRMFVGAMCAAGTLNVNKFGYPALLLKILSFLLAGVWLTINYTDNRAYDYPLIRIKYSLLLIAAPFFITETFLLISYLARLRADVITSCCGSLFGSQKQALLSELTSIPPTQAKTLFFAVALSTITSALYFLRTNRGAYVFSTLSAIAFLISIVAIISFISLYFYELPTHHCPFCILQKDYKYIGYPIYISLFTAAVCGISVGIINPFREVTSLKEVIPSLQKRLTLVSFISYVIFFLIVVYPLLFSEFKLQ